MFLLQLSGHSLDLYDKPTMDNIFSQMHSVRSSLPSNIVNLLDSVVSLRGRNWDHGSSSSSASSQLANGSVNCDDAAVLLSPEESAFFYEHM